jgi:phosphoglycolate phosphatase-like HAD superfamily hydrolase
MKKLAIVDLDGIVANRDARFARATTNGKINWKVAFDPALVELDTLIDGCPACLDKLESNGYRVVFLTSRPETMQQATERWLLKHDLLYSYRRLILKPLSKQYTKTKIWKAYAVKALIDEMQPKRAIFIDDERANIETVAEMVPDVMCFLALNEAY